MMDWMHISSKARDLANRILPHVRDWQGWPILRKTHNDGVARFGLAIVFTVELLGMVALTFALVPSLDLVAAQQNFENGHFIGRDGAGPVLRVMGWLVPFSILGTAILGWAARQASTHWAWITEKLPALTQIPWSAPIVTVWTWLVPKLSMFTHLRVLYLVLTMALGPGLLVNVILKDHSHRPRPVQVQAFGGDLIFKPWWHLDGGCKTNCSFVSGEASSAIWLLAPALLVPQPFQPLAVASALMFGIAVGRLRMAFGGHFLSDTLMSMLLTILVVLVVWRWLNPAPFQAPKVGSPPI